MSFVDDGFAIADGEWGRTTERVRRSTDALGVSATAFAGTMTRAFAGAVSGGKQFDDVLKSLALRLSNMTVRAAFQPLSKNFVRGLNDVFAGLFGGGAGNAHAPVLPFASGGVIGAPSYFPLASGGLGLAGEAGPEAIMPLARGSDGRLGVAVSGAPAQPNVIVQITTPDPDSFRRSEAYITGQIARAVARGQRGL